MSLLHMIAKGYEGGIGREYGAGRKDRETIETSQLNRAVKAAQFDEWVTTQDSRIRQTVAEQELGTDVARSKQELLPGQTTLAHGETARSQQRVDQDLIAEGVAPHLSSTGFTSAEQAKGQRAKLVRSMGEDKVAAWEKEQGFDLNNWSPEMQGNFSRAYEQSLHARSDRQWQEHMKGMELDAMVRKAAAGQKPFEFKQPEYNDAYQSLLMQFRAAGSDVERQHIQKKLGNLFTMIQNGASAESLANSMDAEDKKMAMSEDMLNKSLFQISGGTVDLKDLGEMSPSSQSAISFMRNYYSDAIGVAGGKAPEQAMAELQTRFDVQVKSGFGGTEVVLTPKDLDASEEYRQYIERMATNQQELMRMQLEASALHTGFIERENILLKAPNPMY